VNEKMKKAAIVFLYKSMVCICLFCVSVILSRVFPGIWEKCIAAINTHIDFNKAGSLLKKLFFELAPF